MRKGIVSAAKFPADPVDDGLDLRHPARNCKTSCLPEFPALGCCHIRNDRTNARNDVGDGFAGIDEGDDLAFGKLLADQGFHAPMMRGEALARVHMYANRRQMWHGVSRLGTGSLRYSGLTALLPALFITGVMTPLWTLLFERRHLRAMPRLWVIWLTAVLGFIPWAKRFYGKQKTENKKWKTVLRALMAPPAAVFLQTSTVWGFVSRLLGSGIVWKRRKV
mgnify:CR=1 FL=1